MSGEHLPPLRFSFLTPLYDWTVSWSSAEARFRPALVELVAACAPREVLELGCGTGTLARLISRRLPAANVTGIDADRRALRIAQAKATAAGPVRFLLADARHLPQIAPVDVVVASLFFHHLHRDGRQSVMQEIHRVLRPQGTLLIADWGSPETLRERLGFHAVRLLDGYERTAAHAAGFFADEVRAAGFSVVEHESFPALVGRIRLWSAQRSPQRDI